MSPVTHQRTIVSLHKLATIGIVKNFGKSKQWFGYRRDMSPESLQELVEDFVQTLEAAQREMESLIPQSICDGLKFYHEKRKNNENESEEFKKMFHAKLTFLESLMVLPTYSWNGQKYDLGVIIGPLIHTFSKQIGKFGKMNVIKRGTQFMEIKYGRLSFRDFINYSNPMSLGKL